MQTETKEYYVPHQSYFPIAASVSLFFIAYGSGSVLTAAENTGDLGMIMLLLGFVFMLFIIISWFSKGLRKCLSLLNSLEMIATINKLL
jgi:hypothetical protein